MPTATKRRPRTNVGTSAQPPTLVTQYAEDVVAGRVVTGKLVRLACERHLRDLIDGPGRGLRFDVAAANLAIQFFGNLTLPDGANAGKMFNLEP